MSTSQKVSYVSTVVFCVLYVTTAIISLSFVLAKSVLAHLF